MKVTWLSLGDIASILLQDTKNIRPPTARPVRLPVVVEHTPHLLKAGWLSFPLVCSPSLFFPSNLFRLG